MCSAGLRRGCAAAFFAFLFCAAEPVEAQRDPGGAVAGYGLFPGRGDVGGGVLVDLGFGSGELQLGAALGVSAITSDADDRSRVFMPLALSAAWLPCFSGFAPTLRVRAGGWGGATSDGLRAGGFFSVGALAGGLLSPSLRVGAGLELQALLGHGARLIWAPVINLTWTPLEQDP